MFYERGYATATVQDIADALGILKGSLYYYIDTKEDLLLRLLERVHDEVDVYLEQAREPADLTPLQRLAMYVSLQAEFNMRNLVPITVYYHDVDQLSPAARKRIISRRKAHEEFVRELIVAAQEDGSVDPEGDPDLLTNLVFGTIIWTYRWYQPRGRHGVDEVAALCAAWVSAALTGVGQPALPTA